jgi:murein L,D-transpeptidase YcbB/YkuD
LKITFFSFLFSIVLAPLCEGWSSQISTPLKGVLENHKFEKSPVALERMTYKFYQGQEFKPFWTEGSTVLPVVQAALETLTHAAEEGLDPGAYEKAVQLFKDAGSDPVKLLEAEIALTTSVLNYIEDLDGERLSPHKINREFHIKDKQIDAAAVLASESAKDPTGEWLRTRTISIPEYQYLKKLLAQYRDKPSSDRFKQIIVTMERWRWMPDEREDRYVQVNIAAFQLKAVEKGKVVLDMPVIIGQRYRHTPVFSSKIYSIRFNPSWHVPYSIAVRDKLPKIRNDPSYLTRGGFVLYDSSGDVISPESVDWSSVSESNFDFHLRQVPGNHNALGKIRFSIDSPYGVYLHSTNDKQLFKKAVRTLSSGCIRVAEPNKLAFFVFNQPDVWTPEHIAQNMEGTRTQNVELEKPVTVYISYFTVWEGPDGKPHFGEDVYGQDAAIWRALEGLKHL